MLPTVDERTFPELVEEYRRSRGLTQAQVAAYLGVNQADVSRWAKGAKPKPQAVIRFARLARMDYRLALRSAGYWPPDVPVEAEPGNQPATPGEVELAWRHAVDQHPDVTPEEVARLIRAWAALPRWMREEELADVERIAARPEVRALVEAEARERADREPPA